MLPDILYPVTALVALTAVVWVRLYVERLGELLERKIEPQSLATAAAAGRSLQRVQASDNFKNLFEVPVLFYALCAFIAAADLTSPLLLASAWVFVALRCVHSLIHLTYNRVTHRFIAYVASTVLLFGMWGVFIAKLMDAAP